MKYKFLKPILFGVGVALLGGCASNTQPVKNTKIGSNELVVEFRYSGGKQEFTEITNERIWGFYLNNYQPIGFDTAYKKLGFDNVYQTIGKVKFKSDDKYVKIGCEATSTAVMNVFPPFWLLGSFCDKAQYFDYESFDKDAKDWIEDNKINQKEILSKYDTLKTTQHISQQEINELANTKYSVMVERYYQDSEKLKSSIFPNSNLKPKNINLKRDPISYQYIVDKTFPCKTDCVNKMERAIKDIQSAYARDKNKFETSDVELTQLSESMKQYLSQYKVDLEKAKKIEENRLAQIVAEKAKQQKIQEEMEKQQKIKDAANKKAFEEQMKKMGE